MTRLRQMVEEFCTALDCVDAGFIPDGLLDALPAASQLGGTAPAASMSTSPAAGPCSPPPSRWPSPPAASPSPASPPRSAPRPDRCYTIRNAAYDLRKLRGKHLAGKPGRTRRYLISPAAARIISALLTLREDVIAPLLAGVADPRIRRTPRHWTDIDRHYQALRLEMMALFADIGIACG
ncbi:MAG TPA: hypothetical protein VEH31_29795 [Streptosporangiaceae bacterium]|nr:hypothetical protein [Streptosporangiaceae bacterium]